MDVKQQEYIVAIVEEGNISRAAKRLYITQPTLSEYLNRAEQAMKAKLFIREKNGSLTLTDAGLLYYESAKEILKIRDDFQSKLADLDKLSSVRLRFGVNAGRGIRILSGLLSSLSDQYPNVHLETRQAPADTLKQLVINNELDMAYSAYDSTVSELSYIDFLPCELALAVSISHPLAHLGSTSPHDSLPHLPLERFQDETFALLKRGTVLRRVSDGYIKETGLALNVKIEAHDITTAMSVAESSRHVVFCPYDLLPTAKYAKLSYIGLDPPLHYQTGLYYSKSGYQTKFMKDFLASAKKLSNFSFHDIDDAWGNTNFLP